MKYSNRLISTLLIGGGLLNAVAPVFAADIATLKDTQIDNTAAATYDDPSGNTINATSNTVTVKVAEVAGIDVTASGIVNKTDPGGSVKVADDLYYNYTITNIGNAPTAFHVPANPSLTGPGSVTKVEYFNGTAWVPVTTDPATQTTGVVPVNGSVPVRVTILANNTGTNNNVIEVRLGNTPNNLPNQPLLASGANDDVNTTGGSPANGPRESSATQKTSVGAVVKNIALAAVTEKRTGVFDNGTPANLNDDVLTYELGINVADTDVTNTGLTPAPLAGTVIKVDATGTGTVTATRILVSSAIPTGTTFVASATVPPAGWTMVYSIDDPATIMANAASWSTTAPAPGTVKRIGFINDPTKLTTIAPGATVAGLTFQVKETAATGTSYTVDSMAQLFGATDSTETAVKAAVVYDESGDSTVNNYDPALPLSPTAGTTIGTGIADVAYGIDAANDNTGTGLGGEINEYIYTYVAPNASSLLNGPLGIPNAMGPDATGAITNNFDFTNKSSTVPAGLAPTATFDPAPVGFFNTVQNTGTAAANIKLLPESTTATVTNSLPAGTKVKIYTTGANSQSAIYVVTANGFDFINGTGGTSESIPVSLPNVAPGGFGEYQVEVDLPESTTGVAATTAAKAFPVVINAFTDGAITVAVGGEVSVANPSASNKTIDKAYTGFIKMNKMTRILQGTGPAVVTGDETFSITPKTPAQGNIIEYQITYTNISDKLVGTGNVVLNANNLVITEDGSMTSTANKWGHDQDSNGIIDTSNVAGSAVGSAGTVKWFNGLAGTVAATDKVGTSATDDVTKYINSLGTTVVGPGNLGTFTFQRKLN